MAQHRTIADFDLVRHTTASFMDLRLESIHSYIGDTTARDWTFCKVTNPSNPELQFTYAVCVSKAVFVLFDANLTNGRDPTDKLYRRYTAMQTWELLLDCWKDAAKSNTNTLLYVGISDIVNADVRRLIQKEIQSQESSSGTLLETAQVTVGPGSMTWGANYFIRAAERVAAMLNKKVVRATLSTSTTNISQSTSRASNGSEIDNIFLELDMILELR